MADVTEDISNAANSQKSYSRIYAEDKLKKFITDDETSGTSNEDGTSVGLVYPIMKESKIPFNNSTFVSACS